MCGGLRICFTHSCCCAVARNTTAHAPPPLHTHARAQQLIILDAHARKQAEQAEFAAALAAALAERDGQGRALIQHYDKMHKHLMRGQGSVSVAGAAGQQQPEPASSEEQVHACASW